MKKFWENDWFTVPTAMFFGFFGMLALLVPYSREILFLNEYRREPFNTCFQVITLAGEAWAFVVCGVVMLFWRPRYTLLIGLMGIIAMPTMYAVKDVLAVDRPITYFESNGTADSLALVPDVVLHRGKTSFPSGHSMAAFALCSLLATMLSELDRRLALLLSLLAVLVGLSRIFLVQHFLADVLAGGAMGLLFSAFIWQLGYKLNILKKS